MLEKSIKDLMIHLKELERISPLTKVAKAVKILDHEMANRRPPFLLVVDETDNEEEILGMLSVDDILGHAELSTESTEELPIFWQGQFRDEYAAILQSPSSQIMSPVTRVIHQRGTLMEAIHLMNSDKIDWLPVVEGGHVTGILFKQDLFKELLSEERLKDGQSLHVITPTDEPGAELIR